MIKRTVVRAVALSAALAIALAACSSDDGDDDSSKVKVLGTDGNTGQTFADNFKKDKGALEGMRGTLPLTDLSKDFQDRLKAVNPDLEAYNYAGESYDAVTIAGLSAELARSSEGTEIAKYVNSVTTKGEKCTSFKDCKALIDQDKDIDYDGASGPLEFTDPGEPSVASFGIMSYNNDNKVSDTKFVVAGDKEQATKAEIAPAARSTSPSGGPLKYGALLPQTGGLAIFGPSMYAGVNLAVKEINEAGGVNSAEVTSEERDDGTDPNVAGPSADALLQADVDVIVGAAGSTVSKSVLEKITGNGVVMISPSNTSDEFTTISDNGLYFRTAPPDVLQAKPLANLVLEDGSDRVVVMHQNTAYGEGLAKNVKANLVTGDVPDGDILVIPYDEKGKDFSSEVNKAQAHDPEYILVIGYDESKTIITKLNEKGIGPKR